MSARYAATRFLRDRTRDGAPARPSVRWTRSSEINVQSNGNTEVGFVRDASEAVACSCSRGPQSTTAPGHRRTTMPGPLWHERCRLRTILRRSEAQGWADTQCRA